ncbi:MAG: FHA domain-containing protein [Sphaerobacter sp.]|nr:FHA domain-containing protein [Sphaerobacter sp.]
MHGPSWINLLLGAGLALWVVELLVIWRAATREGADPIARVSGAAIFFVLALPVAIAAPDLVERLAGFWERLTAFDAGSGRGEPVARLVIGGKSFPLTGERIRIGRFGNNDLVLDHPTVSAYHAELVRRPDGRYELTDNASSNGTRINGTPIRSAVLRDGDLITIGALSMHYLMRPAGEPGLEGAPRLSRRRAG